jgi:hypothetical protein
VVDFFIFRIEVKAIAAMPKDIASMVKDTQPLVKNTIPKTLRYRFSGRPERPVQPENACGQISITLFGMVMDVRLLQL